MTKTPIYLMKPLSIVEITQIRYYYDGFQGKYRNVNGPKDRIPTICACGNPPGDDGEVEKHHYALNMCGHGLSEVLCKVCYLNTTRNPWEDFNANRVWTVLEAQEHRRLQANHFIRLGAYLLGLVRQLR
jgi:hypothetical protein